MAYIPHTNEDIQQMLQIIGKKSIEELFQEIPSQVRMQGEYNIPTSMSEPELLRHLQQLAQKNQDLDHKTSFLGAGIYEHFIPVLVDYLSGRGEFSTAYTPYQPETSQGNLQAIFEYQTVICELTGMDIANASMYDGHTALAEAVLLAYSHHRQKRTQILVPKSLHPEYRQVLATYLQNIHVEIVEMPEKDGLVDVAKLASLALDQVAGVVIASPNFYGLLEDCQSIAKIAHEKGCVALALVNCVALGILATPRSYDADIVVGEGQQLGVPASYGGPAFGFMAAKEEFLRKMPGRIVGQTVDGNGNRGFVLTIQTREQHIKREKATSNICSNQALMALRGLIYLTCLGKKGFRELANQCLQKAHYLAKAIAQIPGFKLTYASPFFNEFVITCPKPASEVLQKLAKQNIYAGVGLSQWFADRDHEILVAVTECRTKADMDQLVESLRSL